ncbi:hypothetical protein ACEWY4_018402 [Coilia grayii]|uniref:Gypsy retrotransposon integrase-like protein 1 n=1 Tax=Coilia grayii TaxID=363190 RepID=A0ABD1JD65_9TELE
MSVVDEFVKNPSVDILSRCTKEKLNQIAEHFSVNITSDDKKLRDTLLKAVVSGLIEKQILPAHAEAPVVSPVPFTPAASRTPFKEYAPEERKLLLEAARSRVERESRKELEKEVEIKKLELQLELDLRKLDYEAQEKERGRVHQLQREREERDFALKKLQIEMAVKGLTISPHGPPAASLHGSPPSSPVRNTIHSAASVSALSGTAVSASPPSVPLGDVAPQVSASGGYSPVTAPSAPLSVPMGSSDSVPQPSVPFVQHFDVARNARMVPPFNEREVEKYFMHFERVALILKWPVDVWTILLQTVLRGKAQSVYAALSVQQGSDYQYVKTAILNAYELVPEAYRQKFRGLRKNPSFTYVEFAREKEQAFERWCASQRARTAEQLKELVLLEEFKNCVPASVAMYLNDQKVTTLAQAAVCADEFVLTHKSSFQSPRLSRSNSIHTPSFQTSSVQQSFRSSRLDNVSHKSESRECYYCHEVGHLIVDCPVLKKKSSLPKRTGSKGSGFVRKTLQTRCEIDPDYQPFVLDGTVSLTGCEEDAVPVTILRDTGSAQSFVLASTLPFSDESYCGSDVLVQGIGLQPLKVPLHTVHLKSTIVSGCFKIAVQSQLPMDGISFLLGNDLAGVKVFPLPEVVSTPVACVDSSFSEFFPVCVVTRAQARKSEPSDLCDTFLTFDNPLCSSPNSSGDCAPRSLSTTDGAEIANSVPSLSKPDGAANVFAHPLSLAIDRELLRCEQRKDQSLAKYRAMAVGKRGSMCKTVVYFWENGLLMRRWTPSQSQDLGWNSAVQLVVPAKFRLHVLTLGHDCDFAGHLGVKKTYHRILRYFFWPGLKSDVVKHCRSCHHCQLAGKPNQVIKPAPLRPIPVIGEPFQRILLDCVGPLPKTKSGHRFLLTIMCAATRYPEAVPLRSLKAKPVVKALIRFFSTFGLPEVVQTDQGSNFLSRLFKQVLQQLSVKHVTSSAYHPESQGALERFHQTLKSMFRTYCFDSAKEWDEGLPLLLFAVRETTQESLGFSPADLIFGHTVRGPLKLLREKWDGGPTSHDQNILDYVSSFRERLHNACACAQKALASAQVKMKTRYDRKSVDRSFQPGDKVLVLLPVVGSALQAKFSGPYEVESKLSTTDYVIRTPDRKRKTRVCHLNMLKPYVSRESEVNVCPVSVGSVTPVLPSYCPEEDGLCFRDVPVSSPRLQNSEALKDLPSFLAHLSGSRAKDVQRLIESFPELFFDVPSRTNVLSHDICVNDHLPIKQHAYRVNPTKRAIMSAEVKYLVDNGLAKPSSSAWSSPCLLVPKPDGTFRFCTDYRKVNAVTKPDSFPLPRMEDCVDRVGSATFVSKLDLLKGYWQVPLTSHAAEISAFVTPDCFMQYSVMPFGLRNAPATFQRLMCKVLAGINNCEVYLDDIVCHSSSWSDHLELLFVVFCRLRDASLTLNLAKCEFGKATVTYLGKQVGQGKVKPLEAKILAIKDFPTPQTKRELRRFLGMAGYYRSFCPNFSDVVLPLTNLLRNTSDFVWSCDCDTAFQNAKALLCCSPVLAAPNFDLPFKLEVDASATGAGAVLLQEGTDGLDHPVCYFSKKFLKHQLNYSTIEKEALALLLALQHFEVYVGSSSVPVTVFTDHNPLIFLSRMKNTNQRIMRWSLYLQGFNLDLRYKRGTDNILADTLSRAYQ